MDDVTDMPEGVLAVLAADAEGRAKAKMPPEQYAAYDAAFKAAVAADDADARLTGDKVRALMERFATGDLSDLLSGDREANYGTELEGMTAAELLTIAHECINAKRFLQMVQELVIVTAKGNINKQIKAIGGRVL